MTMCRCRALLLILSANALGQSNPAILAPGAPLTIQLDTQAPMRLGAPLTGHLLHPVYQENHLILPEGTLVYGTVTALQPDRSRRIHGRLRADFTPFHIPVVQFHQGTVTNGAPVYSLVGPPPSKGGFLHQEIGFAKTAMQGDIAIVTGPNKGQRLVTFVYSQLPYHPESISRGTAWTTEVSQPLTIGGSASDPLLVPLSERKQGDSHTWLPEGAQLLGSVVQGRPARKFARAGVLRFHFREMKLPSGVHTSVQATLKAADSGDAQLALDSEGQAKLKPQDKLALPLFLVALAGRPLDPHHGGPTAGKDAAGSNGFGIIDRVVGIAAGSADLAAGIGYY